MGLLSKAQSYLQTVMEAEGQSINYVRGSTVLPFMATPDMPDDMGWQAFGDDATVVAEKLDWAFAWSQLVTLDPAEPRDGDVITKVFGGNTHQWVVRPDSNGKCFAELDTRRSRIAAHTVYSGVVG